MKKILLSIFSLSILCIMPNPSFAQNMGTPAEKTVNTSLYQLAYPGILPDNPFYKLKVLRDKMIDSFISNPTKKVDFYLLQTDKGIAAMDLLVKKGEINLAEKTGLKAENNYTLLTYVVGAHKNDIPSKEYKKLYDAAQKHQEVLQSIIASTSKDQQKTFKTILYFSKQNVNEIKNIADTRD